MPFDFAKPAQQFGTLPFQQLGFDAVTCTYDPATFTDHHFAKFGIPFDPSLRRAVQARKAEYFAGRLCASQALSMIDRQGDVQADHDRCPIWPRGTIGSISHCANHAAAVALPTATQSGVGIDIECRSVFAAANLDKMRVMSDSELAILRNSTLPANDHAALVFSVKESFFKLAYPQARHYFGFFAVALSQIDTDSQTVTLNVQTNLSFDLQPGKLVLGAYKFLDDGLIATAVKQDRGTARP